MYSLCMVDVDMYFVWFFSLSFTAFLDIYCVSFVVVPVFLLLCYYLQERQCHTVQLQSFPLMCITIICIMIIILTQYAAPHKSNRCPHFTQICEFWPLMPNWEFVFLFTYLGRDPTPMALKSQVIYINIL